MQREDAAVAAAAAALLSPPALVQRADTRKRVTDRATNPLLPPRRQTEEPATGAKRRDGTDSETQTPAAAASDGTGAGRRSPPIEEV
ncbi:unnamed protein product [Pleuronectes platessa]|uniref:Uncharacterized protein n=1 Tax=Pleuronectes platessa TaxID=8262 RepID=A0A9N7V3A5_PLEPL|nr:unnamed protein product [Pleuronectes platessa]